MAGIFALLITVGTLKHIQSVLTKADFKVIFIVGGVAAAFVVFFTVVLLTYLGVIAPWSGRFYSLWDTGYAKIHIPIIASVSEHQPTTWCSFFFDFHILVATFPVGLWYCIKNVNDERVFGECFYIYSIYLIYFKQIFGKLFSFFLYMYIVILYSLSAVYFAGVMVRLILTLTPVVCMLSGIAFSILFNLFLKEEIIVSQDSDSEDGSNGKNSKNMYDKVSMNKLPFVLQTY